MQSPWAITRDRPTPRYYKDGSETSEDSESLASEDLPIRQGRMVQSKGAQGSPYIQWGQE